MNLKQFITNLMVRLEDISKSAEEYHAKPEHEQAKEIVDTLLGHSGKNDRGAMVEKPGRLDTAIAAHNELSKHASNHKHLSGQHWDDSAQKLTKYKEELVPHSLKLHHPETRGESSKEIHRISNELMNHPKNTHSVYGHILDPKAPESLEKSIKWERERPRAKKETGREVRAPGLGIAPQGFVMTPKQIEAAKEAPKVKQKAPTKKEREKTDNEKMRERIRAAGGKINPNTSLKVIAKTTTIPRFMQKKDDEE